MYFRIAFPNLRNLEKKIRITKKAGAKLLREINGNKTVIPDFDRFNFFGGQKQCQNRVPRPKIRQIRCKTKNFEDESCFRKIRIFGFFPEFAIFQKLAENFER